MNSNTAPAMSLVYSASHIKVDHAMHGKTLTAVQTVLMPVQSQSVPLSKSKSILGLVIAAHLLSIYLLIQQAPNNIDLTKPLPPMQVSLIAPPAPEPELVPIVEAPTLKEVQKPVVKKPSVQPKKLEKVIENIQPVEVPSERVVEAAATAEAKQSIAESVTQPAPEVAEIKSPPKAEPVVEEKIEPPKFGVAYLQNPEPEYPRMSKRLGEQGRVLLHVLVDPQGNPSEVTLKKTSGFERLDEAAISAVKGWRFVPATKNKVALAAYVDVPIKFSLQ